MGDKLAVGAALDDGAAVHDDDFVGVADGGEAVCDDDAGAAQHELVEGLPYRRMLLEQQFLE